MYGFTRKLLPRNTNRELGDTIVEVIVAIAILGLSIGGAYALANRAFHTAQNTDERVEALALAQGQAEFLRDLGLKDQINILPAQFLAGDAFCFKDDDGNAVAADDEYCDNYGPSDSIYDVSINYCGTAGCSPPNVFNIKVNWDRAGGGEVNSLTLYYRPPS